MNQSSDIAGADRNAKEVNNPFAYSINAQNLEHGIDMPQAIDGLRGMASWMTYCIGVSVLFVLIWMGFGLTAFYVNWRAGRWVPRGLAFSLFGLVIFAVFMWPDYLIIRIRKASYRAVEEQTLSSIADVLEAQRSFWRALGILVLLAIAAIVALAIVFA